MGRISVIVLGDIGRSPRMQYHSISLSEAGHHVDLIGYPGSKPHRLISENEKITLHHLAEPPVIGGGFGLIVKCIWQAITLFWCLLMTVTSDVILLQNPPGLPALFVCWMVARLKGAKLVVDWHNFTWSILALKWGQNHPMVNLVRWYEYSVGKWADYGFSVSMEMENFLRNSQSIHTKTFYDRPLKGVFRPIDMKERHDIMTRMADISPEIFDGDKANGSNCFTETSPNGIQFRKNRPALLISSTSWTADEDFGMLFQAMSLYDQLVEDQSKRLPEIVLVITGKGPLKEHYLSQVPQWNHIRICTPWLAAEDYPLLLASADLGVCLHESSSSMDLPMKAVDMLGCRIPVLALKYSCIDELVKEGINGQLFVDAQSLADSMSDLLGGFGGHCGLEKLRRRLNEDRDTNGEGWDWETNWKKVVGPNIMP